MPKKDTNRPQTTGKSKRYEEWVDEGAAVERTEPDATDVPCDDRAMVTHGRESYDSGWCSTENLIDIRLTLPEEKPDIERLLRVSANPKVREWEVVCTSHGDKVVVFGDLIVHVEYVALVGGQSVHFCSFNVPFHTFFPCARSVQRVRSVAEHIHFQPCGARSISLATLLFTEGQ